MPSPSLGEKKKTIRCRTARQMMRRQAEGKLAPREASWLAAHLADCPVCRESPEAHSGARAAAASASPDLQSEETAPVFPSRAPLRPFIHLAWIAVLSAVVFIWLAKPMTQPAVNEPRSDRPARASEASPPHSVRVGGGPTSATYQLRVSNAPLAQRILTDLVSIIGGGARSSEIEEGGRRIIQIEFSVPPDQTAYFLTKLEGLGRLSPSPPGPDDPPIPDDSSEPNIIVHILEP